MPPHSRRIGFPILFAMLMLLLATRTSAQAQPEPRKRLRELGVTIGRYPTGYWNAITDVAGVRVGHKTLRRGHGKLVPGQGPVRTGVTVIIPREDVWKQKVPAASFVLSGTGEMTGLVWIEESGFLEYPVALTNTLAVGRVYNGIISYMLQKYPDIGIRDVTTNPVVAECDDSYLNDIQGRHVSEQDTLDALVTARSGPVEEGAVGAGTGMVAFGFKGGVGTASRVLPDTAGGYTVGVLVNANLGRREELTIKGVPVGTLIEAPSNARRTEGSIIIIIATDAPLSARQLKRVARRTAEGLARTGTTAREGSGEIFLAFSTGNTIPHRPPARTYTLTEVADIYLNPLFEATAETTEEAVLNALTMAETTVGRDGHTAVGIPLERLRELLRQYNQLR